MRALVWGALGWSGNALKTVVMCVGPLQGTSFWSVGDGFDLEVVLIAFVLVAFGWSGNALKTVVMRAGPLRGS